MLIFQRLDTTYAGPDNDSDPLRVFSIHLQPGMFEGLRRGVDGVLDESILSANLFSIQHLLRIEILELAGDLHLLVRWIEPGDRPDAGTPCRQRVPEGIDGIAVGC